VIVNSKNEPVGIFSDKDGAGYDRFTELAYVMTKNPVTIPYGTALDQIFNLLHKSHVTIAPVVKEGKIAGIVSQKGLLRSEIYKPALNKKGKLLTAVAIGINGDPKEKAERLLEMGVDVLVLDTAHGYQEKMIKAIKAVRSVSSDVPLVAGNVVTAEATCELIKAGANIVKVGLGPGAMCTTRIMTAVGRPQFSAVLECATTARKLGANVWADGGVRYPRDVALALAAGASSVMIGTMLAATYESVGDTLIDEKGRLYKENFGMASRRAVQARIKDVPLFDQMKKEFFEEGISTSKLYIDQERPGAEDVLDYIVAGLRSAIAYCGAADLNTFYKKAVVGIQSPAGFDEGKAVDNSWDKI
jgi:IMP dehydrogenase